MHYTSMFHFYGTTKLLKSAKVNNIMDFILKTAKLTVNQVSFQQII